MPRLRISRRPLSALATGSTVLGAPSILVSRQGFQGQDGQDGDQNGHGGGSNNNNSGPSSTDNSGGSINSTAIIIVVVVVVVIVVICLFLYLRLIRSRNANPKFLPKPLKKLWSKWDVSPTVSKAKYARTGDGSDDRFQNRLRMREAQDNFDDALQDALAQQETARALANGNTVNGQAGVDRHTSVRSVMTLPAYRPQPTENEQVLGREGERAGIDTVVEMPTAEDEEAMREEEMEALYQIRLARRRQIAEREERRQERRDARERNDNRALAELRTRARLANEQGHRDLEGLRDQHDSARQIRQRAVSSVSYADLGVVRADGTRLRADSVDSENVGLLSDAASIALRQRDSHVSLQHRRAPSSQSVLSIDTGHSSNEHTGSPAHGTGRSRASSRGPMTESYVMPRVGSALSQRAGSTPEMIDAAEADLGDNLMPPHSPPGYDDVSLDDVELTRSHNTGQSDISNPSGRNSPYNEPPPDYPGPEQQQQRQEQQQQQQQQEQQHRESPTQARQNRLSAQMADLAIEQHLTAPEQQQADRGHVRTTSRGVGGVPQLPSLRLNRLPQIVIEPSSAFPRDEHELDSISERR